LFDLSKSSLDEIHQEENEIKKLNIPFLKVGNKMDQADPAIIKQLEAEDFILISASQKKNIQHLKDKILSRFQINQVKQGDVLVTNLRHFQNLRRPTNPLTGYWQAWTPVSPAILWRWISGKHSITWEKLRGR